VVKIEIQMGFSKIDLKMTTEVCIIEVDKKFLGIKQNGTISILQKDIVIRY
jgi:hypothetical protein